MKPANCRIVLSFCLLLLCCRAAAAQKTEPLHADWLANDVANMERILPQLKQAEPLTVEALATIFNSPDANKRINWLGEDNGLGFGGQTFDFSKPAGYAYLRVRGFAFNGAIGNYTISLDTSADSWPRIKSVLIDVWNRNGGPEFTEDQWGIRHHRKFANVVADYKQAVAKQLGEMQPVNVPPGLKDSYEMLISLGQN